MKVIRYVLFCTLLLSKMVLHAQEQPAPFKVFFEKVYLHTDRDIYTQGDTIWFKAYLVNAQNNTPIGTSGNLYVEMISDKAEILTREIIRLDAGNGHGDFKLTDSIPSGRYTLRAYTNWMRNFGDNFVFEKNITIYNTQPPGKVVVAAVSPDKIKPTKAAAKTPVVHVNNVNLRFYPEGGSMVEGLNSLVAVKAEDAQGKGIAVKGAVVNSAGDTVSHFVCDTLGMGMLSLLPISGQYYQGVVSYKNTPYAAELPQALIKGPVMRISSTDTLINVTISCSDMLDQQFSLLGRYGGKLLFNRSLQLNAGYATVKIAKSVLPDGITAITLNDASGKPNCERLVYVRHPAKAALVITTDKPAYQPKGKVTIKLKLNDTSAKANLSMAVVDANITPAQYSNIENYLLLTSELKGHIEHPERYFDTTNVNRFKQLDLLLMTQGWRDFVWRRVADSAIRISYAAEDNFAINGKVRQKFANKPLADLNITLTAFKARGTKIFSTKTDSIGHFNIDGLQLYGQQPIKLVTSDNKGNHKGWITIDSLTLDPLPVLAKPTYIIDTPRINTIAITKRQADVQAAKLRSGNVLKEVKIKASKYTHLSNMTAATFGYDDQVFDITKKDEYFQAVDNWVAHNVKGAYVNGSDGVLFGGQGYEPKLGSGKWMYPRLIVNGREVIPPLGHYSSGRGNVILGLSDEDFEMRRAMQQQYWDLGMDKVKKVVLKHLVGPNPDDGGSIDVYLLYLTVTDDAFDKVDFGFVAASVNGYYNARTFYKPLYDTAKDLKKEDYRTTIHWEPYIKTVNGEAIVTFYNADPKTTVRVVVQGITDKGVPVNVTTTYKVQ